MPSWLVTLLIPSLIQVITPLAVSLVKQGIAWLGVKLPGSAVVPLVAVLSEAVNQGQAIMTSTPLPMGFGALIAVLLKEAHKDLSEMVKSPPGM